MQRKSLPARGVIGRGEHARVLKRRRRLHAVAQLIVLDDSQLLVDVGIGERCAVQRTRDGVALGAILLREHEAGLVSLPQLLAGIHAVVGHAGLFPVVLERPLHAPERGRGLEDHELHEDLDLDLARYDRVRVWVVGGKQVGIEESHEHGERKRSRHTGRDDILDADAQRDREGKAEGDGDGVVVPQVPHGVGERQLLGVLGLRDGSHEHDGRRALHVERKRHIDREPPAQQRLGRVGEHEGNLCPKRKTARKDVFGILVLTRPREAKHRLCPEGPGNLARKLALVYEVSLPESLSVDKGGYLVECIFKHLFVLLGKESTRALHPAVGIFVPGVRHGLEPLATVDGIDTKAQHDAGGREAHLEGQTRRPAADVHTVQPCHAHGNVAREAHVGIGEHGHQGGSRRRTVYRSIHSLELDVAPVVDAIVGIGEAQGGRTLGQAVVLVVLVEELTLKGGCVQARILVIPRLGGALQPMPSLAALVLELDGHLLARPIQADEERM